MNDNTASGGEQRVDPASLPEEMNLLAQKTPAQAREAGLVIGLGGAAGAAAWFNRHNVAKAMNDVEPATGRGLVHGVLWLVGFGLIIAAGQMLAPGLGGFWGLISLAVMVPVGVLWSRNFGIRR